MILRLFLKALRGSSAHAAFVKHYTTTLSQVLTAASAVLDSVSFSEAMKSKDKDSWLKAAQEEYESLMQNGTWVLEDLPQGRKVIDGKWVFRRKFKPDGRVDCYKAH